MFSRDPVPRRPDGGQRAFPTTSAELCALERLLEVAYSAAFQRGGSGG
jgi:hypothetical protein